MSKQLTLDQLELTYQDVRQGETALSSSLVPAPAQPDAKPAKAAIGQVKSKKRRSSRHPKVKVSCLTCSKEFYVRQCYIKRGDGKYCSKLCFGAAAAKKAEAVRPVRICPVCGKEFKRRLSAVKKGEAKHCSKACMAIAYNKSKPVVCERCGKTVIKEPSMISRSNHHYCSDKCARADLVGSKSPNWLNGASHKPYCHKFNTEIKEKIRAKFGNRCFLCAGDGGDRKLDVHHCDYLKSAGCAGQQWSLLPLHLKCHIRTNYNRWYWFALLRDYWIYSCPGTFLAELVPPMFVNPPLSKRKTRQTKPSLA